MKNVIRILCLALCLCMLPVFSLAASETMTAYEVRGIPYYIWSDYSEPRVDDIYTYYYKDPDNPLTGSVMIMELEDQSISALEGDISAGLQQAMASLFDGFQSEVVSEPLAIDDRQGYYFFTTFYDMLSMTGYVTLVDQTVVSIVVTSDVLDETVLRPRLMEVLGITEET